MRTPEVYITGYLNGKGAVVRGAGIVSRRPNVTSPATDVTKLMRSSFEAHPDAEGMPRGDGTPNLPADMLALGVRETDAESERPRRRWGGELMNGRAD